MKFRCSAEVIRFGFAWLSEASTSSDGLMPDKTGLRRGWSSFKAIVLREEIVLGGSCWKRSAMVWVNLKCLVVSALAFYTSTSIENLFMWCRHNFCYLLWHGVLGKERSDLFRGKVKQRIAKKKKWNFGRNHRLAGTKYCSSDRSGGEIR